MGNQGSSLRLRSVAGQTSLMLWLVSYWEQGEGARVWPENSFFPCLARGGRNMKGLREMFPGEPACPGKPVKLETQSVHQHGCGVESTRDSVVCGIRGLRTVDGTENTDICQSLAVH